MNYKSTRNRQNMLPYPLFTNVCFNTIGLHHTSETSLFYEIIKQTYRAKQKYAGDTPGSWPARTAKNPVVPTTVKRKAACIIKDLYYMLYLEQNHHERNSNAMLTRSKSVLGATCINFKIFTNCRLQSIGTPKYKK